MTGVSTADERRSIDVMEREIETIPAVIESQAATLRSELRAVAAAVPGTEEVVLTGCGDSHYAGIAARLAFERVARLRCRPVEALELARYEARYVPTEPPPLLVALSYSGEVGRTIEAAAVGRDLGWRTVALTGRADARLASTVERPVTMEVPTLGFSPGTSTYVAMVVALLVLASEIARVRGRTGEADALDASLAASPALAARTLERSAEPARAAAGAVADSPVTAFIGAGPSRASALFGAAKLFEGPQRHGVGQDLEEWAHEQYFVTEPGTPVVVVCPSGASRDRAVELLEEMAFIGARPIVVSDVPTPPSIGAIDLPIATGMDEAASSVLTCLPLAQLGFHVARLRGTESYGFRSEAHEREHYETIHRATRGEPA